MGYTHHYHFTNKPSEIKDGPAKFTQAANLIKKAFAKIPEIKLGDAFGNGEPIITNKIVSFNGKGIGENGESLAAESFAVSMDDNTTPQFCKTNKLPYNLAVCIALICFNEAFEGCFTFQYMTPLGETTYPDWIKAQQIVSSL